MGKFLLFSGLLGAMIGVFFADSLRHIHRADFWWFLEETVDCSSFSQTVHRVYSYPRSRHFAPGDIQLFRPLLFAFSSLELALFGANRTMPWQAAALLLHFLAAVLLFAVLLRLAKPDALAARPWTPYLVPFAISLLFAINCSTQEQVIWTAVTGYVLFAALVLGSLWFFSAALEAPRDRPARRLALLAGCWATTALAAFTYELGVFFALLLALSLPFMQNVGAKLRSRLAVGLVFLLIPAGYALWNEVDWLQRDEYVSAYLEREDLGEQITSTAGKTGLVNNRLLSLHTLANYWHYFMFALVQPFFPNLQYTIGARLQYQEHGVQSLISMLVKTSHLSRLGLLAGTMVLVLWWSLLGLGLVRVRRGLAKVRWPVIVLAAGCLVGHMSLIVLGRMSLRANVLSVNSYYPYLTFLFFLLASYPFVHAGLESGSRLGRMGTWLLPTACCLLALVHGIVVREVNVRMAEQFRYVHDLLASLGELVADKDADYRFAVNYKQSDRQLGLTRIPLPTLCFYRWIDQSNAVDVATIQQGKLTVRPLAEVRPREGTPPYYLEFICYGDYFVYSRLGNNWIAVSHRALPGGQKDVRLEDTTLEGVRQQARARINWHGSREP